MLMLLENKAQEAQIIQLCKQYFVSNNNSNNSSSDFNSNNINNKNIKNTLDVLMFSVAISIILLTPPTPQSRVSGETSVRTE